MVLLWISLIFVFIIYLYYKKVYLFDQKLGSFKSPPEIPILGHALDFLSKDFLGILSKYVDKYGETLYIKIGPNRRLLLIADYKFIEFVLTSMKILEKSCDYRNLDRWLGTGLLTGGGSKWKKHRQVLTPAFHFKILEGFIETFEANVQILIEKLRPECGKDLVNIYPFITMCTLDIICETSMGTKINAQLTGDQSDYVRSVKDVCNIIVERAFSPHKMSDSLYFFTSDYQREKRAVKILHNQTESVIKKREENFQNSDNGGNKKRLAFLDLLLTEYHKGQIKTKDDVRQEVDTFMFAGHDTTASALSFTLYNIAIYPEIQAKIMDEQKRILGPKYDEPITIEKLKEMKYLENVIKETLRLYPSVPFIAREVSEDIDYDGVTLPKGLTLTLFIFNIHRNPKYFPEPLKFDPSRYDKMDTKAPFSYIPFSAGPRSCIGQKFAMFEMKTVISRLLQEFELLPSIPLQEPKLSAETVLISSNGVSMRLKQRSKVE